MEIKSVKFYRKQNNGQIIMTLDFKVEKGNFYIVSNGRFQYASLNSTVKCDSV